MSQEHVELRARAGLRRRRIGRSGLTGLLVENALSGTQRANRASAGEGTVGKLHGYLVSTG